VSHKILPTFCDEAQWDVPRIITCTFDNKHLACVWHSKPVSPSITAAFRK
jgi:hypothetical protein